MGRDTARDAVWAVIGVQAAWFVALTAASPHLAFVGEALIVAVGTRAFVRRLPRSTPLLPSDPPATAAAQTFLVARFQPLVLIAVGNWCWWTFILPAWAGPGVLISSFALVQLCLAPQLQRRERMLVWLAIIAVPLLFPPDYYLLAGLVVDLPAAFFVVRTSGRRRRRSVRLLASLVAAWTTYHLLIGLTGQPFIVPAALAIAIVAGVVVGSHTRARRGVLRAVGLGLRTFAAVAVGSVSIFVWGGIMEHARSATGVPNDSIRAAGPPFPARLGHDRLAVAKAYEPVFVFSEGEHWHPSSPAPYLAEATIYRLSDRTTVEREAVAQTCAAGTHSCVATIDCPDAAQDCAADRDTGPAVVYAHVVDDPLAREGFDKRTARDPVGKLRRIVQYWLFYRYDDWEQWIYHGFHQWHEGDWEWAAVGLGEAGPLFVAYSSHCGGSWETWNHTGAVAAAGRTRQGLLRLPRDFTKGHHAVGWVAAGTHAMYPDGEVREPDWKSCEHHLLPTIADAATWGPSYAAGVREKMSYPDWADRALGPRVELATATSPDFMSFGGSWGPANHIRMFWLGGDCKPVTQALPPGEKPSCDLVPDTPSLKHEWKQPVDAIFCGKYFRPHGFCPRKLRRS